ncbi:MAG: porin family protein [Xanthobacteraceae bacterium]|nr:porin family protein [Xanthobacteraceae bacterium]MBX3535700.1 porin family protein [Xanthobacteraceae bacterium]MCW5678589.1 porin family protein [Xanthobacteraceae bacterium]
MRKTLLSAIAVSAILSGYAAAADLPVKAPVYKAAPVFTWTGWYGGVNAGYGFDPNYYFENPPGTIDQVFNLNPQGGFGGIQIGYNRQMSPVWLIGIEADFQIAGIKDRFNFLYPGGGASYAVLAIDYFSTIRGRIGYVQDRNLYYFTAGGAVAKFQANVYADFDAGDGLINGDKWLGGYVVGIGYERAFDNNWTLKFEYLYLDFAHLNITGVNTNGGGLVALTGDPYLHVVRLGLNLRFATTP